MKDKATVKTGLMNIGEEATPPFVVLPDPTLTFLNRATRLEALSPGHPLEGYLRLIARICRAQAAIQYGLPAVTRETTYGDAPPLLADRIVVDGSADETLVRLATALDGIDAPAAFGSATRSILDATPTARHALLTAALTDAAEGADVAAHAVASAALQVHFTRLAATLDADRIAPVPHGSCPVCDSPPTASAVVNWPGANNTRFCTCSLCATQWHVVRLKCVTCGTTDGIAYPHIEGRDGAIRAETCENCKAYVKIVYQVKDPRLEPFADDVASLDLDMVMKSEGWRRGGRNPFLLGY